jgi:hypothetical protein
MAAGAGGKEQGVAANLLFSGSRITESPIVSDNGRLGRVDPLTFVW